MMRDVSPNQPKTKNRIIRVPDELWERVKAEAAQRNETVATATRRFYEFYVGDRKRP